MMVTLWSLPIMLATTAVRRRCAVLHNGFCLDRLVISWAEGKKATNEIQQAADLLHTPMHFTLTWLPFPG